MKNCRLSILLSLLLFFFSACHQNPKPVQFSVNASENYLKLKKELLHGWNTWNTYSCLSHVHLPDGLAINLYVKDKKSGEILKNAFVWAGVKNKEIIWPGPHAIDGSYTELMLWWKGNAIVVKTASTDNDLVGEIIPADTAKNPGKLIIQPTMLWKRPGEIFRSGSHLSVRLKGEIIPLNIISNAGNIGVNDTCYFNISLRKPIY